MKVLWVTNIEINSIAKEFGATIIIGGWLEQTANLLKAYDDVDLYIACSTSDTGRSYFDKKADGITFFSFDSLAGNPTLGNRIDDIIDCVKPDVVHVWGTEYFHALEVLNSCERHGMREKAVLSMQGLPSVYIHHYYANLPWQVINHRTFKEYFRPNIRKSRDIMKVNGEYEKAALTKADHCIGRTDFDHACVKQINENINYHCVDEILRVPFYEAEPWSYEKCKKRTIFFSQANYPVKGFHTMLMALDIIRKKYPDVVLNVVGADPFNKTFKEKLKRTSYEKYIMDMLNSLNLRDCVKWLGGLNADQMVNQYRNSNVFVCSSSIENSSNSIAEAMILGVPVVASDVGGIKSFMLHEEEGIIFHDEAHYMLADGVMRVFESSELASHLGSNARVRALKIHDRDINMRKLIDVYTSINVGKK